MKEFLVNVVEQKGFVPQGSKRFEKKRKFKNGRSDWKNNKRAYVRQDVNSRFVTKFDVAICNWFSNFCFIQCEIITITCGIGTIKNKLHFPPSFIGSVSIFPFINKTK